MKKPKASLREFVGEFVGGEFVGGEFMGLGVDVGAADGDEQGQEERERGDVWAEVTRTCTASACVCCFDTWGSWILEGDEFTSIIIGRCSISGDSSAAVAGECVDSFSEIPL